MRCSIKFTNLFAVRLILMLTSILLTINPLPSEASNCPPGEEISLTFETAPTVVEVNGSVKYEVKLDQGVSGGEYEWTYEGWAGAIEMDNSITLTAPSTPSTDVGGKTVTCTYTSPNGECKGSTSVAVTVVEIKVNPPTSMRVAESLNSGTFKCEVKPSGLNPTYQWLSGAVNGAWPATAGNTPSLQYSNPTGSSTEVNAARWFAPTATNNILVDGPECQYGIGVEVTINGQKFAKKSASSLSVYVDARGETSAPRMEYYQTIQIAESGGIWRVVGKGDFCRTAAVPSVECEDSSQFVSKLMEHETTHVTQFDTGMLSGLFDVDWTYTYLISPLTAATDSELRDTIADIVYDKTYDGKQKLKVTNPLGFAAEKAAFAAQNAVPPDFLEYVNDDDWYNVYIGW